MKYEELVEELSEATQSTARTAHKHARALLQRLHREEAADVKELAARWHEESAEWVEFGAIGRAHLVVVGEMGQDGARHPVPDAGLTVGRYGDLSFEEDDFLSPVHAKFRWRGQGVYISDNGSRNGTFVRILEKRALEDGDVFLLGRQVLQFSHLSRANVFKKGHDTRAMGSPYPEEVFALRVIGADDEVYDMRRFSGRPIRLGRTSAEDLAKKQDFDVGENEDAQEKVEVLDEEEFVFSDDPFMSETHARVYPEGGRWWLEDTGSSNGTWIRIWERTRLREGDCVFLGKQLLRLEYADLGRGEEE